MMQSTGLQRVRHSLVTEQQQHISNHYTVHLKLMQHLNKLYFKIFYFPNYQKTYFSWVNDIIIPLRDKQISRLCSWSFPFSCATHPSLTIPTECTSKRPTYLSVYFHVHNDRYVYSSSSITESVETS